MDTITARTVLRRVPELSLEIDSSNTVTVTSEGRRLRLGANGLAVIDAFSRPASIAEVLERLRSQDEWNAGLPRPRRDNHGLAGGWAPADRGGDRN